MENQFVQTATGFIAVLAAHTFEVTLASTLISTGLALYGRSKTNRGPRVPSFFPAQKWPGGTAQGTVGGGR